MFSAKNDDNIMELRVTCPLFLKMLNITKGV